jgi:hypothetical protein
LLARGARSRRFAKPSASGSGQVSAVTQALGRPSSRGFGRVGTPARRSAHLGAPGRRRTAPRGQGRLCPTNSGL